MARQNVSRGCWTLPARLSDIPCKTKRHPLFSARDAVITAFRAYFEDATLIDLLTAVKTRVVAAIQVEGTSVSPSGEVYVVSTHSMSSGAKSLMRGACRAGDPTATPSLVTTEGTTTAMWRRSEVPVPTSDDRRSSGALEPNPIDSSESVPRYSMQNSLIETKHQDQASLTEGSPKPQLPSSQAETPVISSMQSSSLRSKSAKHPPFGAGYE